MVADLLQLHHNVQERVLMAARGIAKSSVISRQNILVVIQLNIRELDTNNLFRLGG